MTHESGDEITRLALAAKAGDRDAASDFIRRTQHELVRFLTALADAGDIEDLTQETYLRGLRSLGSFEARSSAKTWLFAIARNVAADHVRHLVRRPRTVAFENWNEEEPRNRNTAGTQFDEAVATRDLLRLLDTDRREAFALTQLLGLSYAEAAHICDCPIGTIRSRVARAREDLIAAAETYIDRRRRPNAV